MMHKLPCKLSELISCNCFRWVVPMVDHHAQEDEKQGQCFKLLYKRSRLEDSLPTNYCIACLKLFLFRRLEEYFYWLSTEPCFPKESSLIWFSVQCIPSSSYFGCMGTGELRYVGGKGSSSTWNCFYMTRICFTFTSLMKYYPHKFFLLLESFSSVHASASYFGCTLICGKCGRKINFQHLKFLSP